VHSSIEVVIIIRTIRIALSLDSIRAIYNMWNTLGL
jgi:hypothetical protein